ncbi:hypothetical protein HAX54_017663 [Datura stramonium]|uniref:Uncharacterized protein n=1 Tax=Datura stramonium TaxID=4076 RepID=A0ABS8UN90_DATST|nr:hypothetical protein [Datura stramonium]
MNDCAGSGEASVSSSGDQAAPSKEAGRKKSENLLECQAFDWDQEAFLQETWRIALSRTRSICDVLAKDSEKAQNAVTTPIADEDLRVQAVVSSTPPTPPTPPPASEPPAVPSPAAPEPLPPPVTPSTAVVSSDSPIQNPDLAESHKFQWNYYQTEPPSSMEPISLCLAMNHSSSVFGSAGQRECGSSAAPQPAMSATALLQKAAQMGAIALNSSLLRGLGILSSTSSSSGQHEWSGRQIDTDGATLAAGLGLGLPCDDGSGLKELMLGTPSVFGPKHPTLDLLGLGMAAGGGPTSGLSSNSIHGH